MKLSTKMKLIRFWDLHKFKVITFFVIFVLSVFRNELLNLINFYKSGLIVKANDPGFIGLFGSILGAIVGGILSLYGTIYSQQASARGKAAILRKNTIYTPLYNEFISLKEILNENPYPSYFEFGLGPQTIRRHPQFNAWDRIKSDTRFLQTPKDLAAALDEYTEGIKKYLGNRGAAASEIQNKLNEILQENFQTICTINNIGDVLLGSIMSEQDLKSNISFTPDNSLTLGRKLTEDEVNKFKLLMCEKAKELDEVNKLRLIYQDLNTKMNEIILYLQVVIRLINEKYESKTILF